jgi:hypothetical protein
MRLLSLELLDCAEGWVHAFADEQLSFGPTLLVGHAHKHVLHMLAEAQPQ